VDVGGDRTARLASPPAQVQQLRRDDRTPSENAIAVVTVVMGPRRSGNRVGSGGAGEPTEHVNPALQRLHFLQRDDVGVDLAQNVENALLRESAVAPDAAVNVVRG